MSLPTNDLASPDQDQIGTVAGIKSEWPAGIVGIRMLIFWGFLISVLFERHTQAVRAWLERALFRDRVKPEARLPV